MVEILLLQGTIPKVSGGPSSGWSVRGIAESGIGPFLNRSYISQTGHAPIWLDQEWVLQAFLYVPDHRGKGAWMNFILFINLVQVQIAGIDFRGNCLVLLATSMKYIRISGDRESA